MNPRNSLFSSSSIDPPVLPFAIFISCVNTFANTLQNEIKENTPPAASLLTRSLRIVTSIHSSVKSFFKKKPRFPFPPISVPKKLCVDKLPDPPFYTYAPARYFWRPKNNIDRDEYASPSCLLKEIREDAETEENSVAILAYARAALPKKGILRQDNKGFIYADVSNEYLDTLIPLLPEGAEKPPYFNYDGPQGAHFGIIMESEYRSKIGLGKEKVSGKTLTFMPTGIYSVIPEEWPEMEKVWFMTVSCKEAERMREQYLLPSKIHSHEFLIVLAVKRKVGFDAGGDGKDLFRLNVSCHAA